MIDHVFSLSHTRFLFSMDNTVRILTFIIFNDSIRNQIIDCVKTNNPERGIRLIEIETQASNALAKDIYFRLHEYDSRIEEEQNCIDQDLFKEG